MSAGGNVSSSAIRRKIRALASVLADRATTAHERANARSLKTRLEDQLKADTAPATPTPPAASAAPEDVWATVMFRLGRGVRAMTAPPAAPKGDWTDHAFRAGRTLRRLFKK